MIKGIVVGFPLATAILTGGYQHASDALDVCG